MSRLGGACGPTSSFGHRHPAIVFWFVLRCVSSFWPVGVLAVLLCKSFHGTGFTLRALPDHTGDTSPPHHSFDFLSVATGQATQKATSNRRRQGVKASARWRFGSSRDGFESLAPVTRLPGGSRRPGSLPVGFKGWLPALFGTIKAAGRETGGLTSQKTGTVAAVRSSKHPFKAQHTPSTPWQPHHGSRRLWLA